MKVRRIKIPIFKYNITLIEIEDYYDYKIIGKELKRFHIPKETFDEIINNTRNSLGGAITLNNKYALQIIVVIYKQCNEITRFGTINHEKRHVVDDIVNNLGIKDSETAAYLDGYISTRIFRYI